MEDQQGDEKKRSADEKELRELETWIENEIKVGLQDKHELVGSSHSEGTGAAFVHKVQEWLDGQVPTLVAHGAPCIGKTHLAYAVISRHFEQPFTSIDGMAYVYCTYDDRDQQTPLIVFAGIALQSIR